MKHDLTHVAIVPDNGYIEFYGPPNHDSPGTVLHGEVNLSVSKPVKIRSMIVKFKGFSSVSHKALDSTVVSIQSPLYPKIKRQLITKATTLTVGDHTLPWELTIPNLFPRSLLIKRAQIHYKVEVAIYTGLHRKVVTAEYPIVLQRHLLRYRELIPLVPTKVYHHTIPGKFHYEIDCPRVIASDQATIPLSIKYLDITAQTSLKAVHTQILQIELYRAEALAKSDCNLELRAQQIGPEIFGQASLQAIKSSPRCIKFVRRKSPMLTHVINSNPESSWTLPTVLEHKMSERPICGLESPHVVLHHQLEVTFDRGNKFHNYRAKIPIIFTSLPAQATPPASPLPKYSFQTQPRYEPPVVKQADQQDLDPEKLLRTQNSIATNLGPRIPSSTRVNAINTVASSSRPQTPSSNALMSDAAVETVGAEAPKPDKPIKPVRPVNITLAADAGPAVLVASPTLSAFGGQREIRRIKSEQSLSVASQRDLRQSHDSKASSMDVPKSTRLTPLSLAAVEKNDPEKRRFSDENGPCMASVVASSEALPVDDREAETNRWSTMAPQGHDPVSNVAPWLAMLMEEFEMDEDMEHDAVIQPPENLYHFSNASVVSRAPSLCSATTTSSYKTCPSLQSRPPSPNFTAAPGLPPSTALQPPGPATSVLIEETFPFSPGVSSLADTIASSAVLTWRTQSALQLQHLMASMAIDKSKPPTPYPDNVHLHYLNAKLPPLPRKEPEEPQDISCMSYYDDSDDDAQYHSAVSEVTSHATRSPHTSVPQLPPLVFDTSHSLDFTINTQPHP